MTAAEARYSVATEAALGRLSPLRATRIREGRFDMKRRFAAVLAATILALFAAGATRAATVGVGNITTDGCGGDCQWTPG